MACSMQLQAKGVATEVAMGRGQIEGRAGARERDQEELLSLGIARLLLTDQLICTMAHASVSIAVGWR